MSQLTFQQGDATWTKLREKGKTDLYFLADTILGYGQHVPMRKHAHGMLCKLASSQTGVPELDAALVCKLLLPRAWGKTSIITISRTIQRLIRDPNCSILLCNEREQTAQDFLSEIKGHFTRNELLRALWPELIPDDRPDEKKWSGSRININRETTRKDPSVFVIGVGGTVTGMHPDYIDVDDMISREAAENARRGSWQIMHEVNRWTHTLKDLLSGSDVPGHRLTFTGTRWFFNDCYDHLDEYFGGDHPKDEWLLSLVVEDGARQTVPVTRQGELVEYRRAKIEEGRASWPERWTMEQMAMEQAGDPILFSANALNNPASDANATFKTDWLKSFQWLGPETVHYVNPQALKTTLHLSQCDIVMLVDPGGFSKGKLSTGDRARAAFWVIAHTPTGEILLLDCWSEKDTYIEAQKQIVAKAKRYRPRKIGIENAGQQIVFIHDTKRLLCDPPQVGGGGGAGLNLVVEEMKTEGKHKDDRILALEPFFQRGMMYLGPGAGFTEFRTQYLQFPRTARRDLLDALAYLPKVLRPRNAPDGQLALRKQQELAEYYRKRGLTPGVRA